MICKKVKHELNDSKLEVSIEGKMRQVIQAVGNLHQRLMSAPVMRDRTIVEGAAWTRIELNEHGFGHKNNLILANLIEEMACNKAGWRKYCSWPTVQG